MLCFELLCFERRTVEALDLMRALRANVIDRVRNQDTREKCEKRGII